MPYSASSFPFHAILQSQAAYLHSFNGLMGRCLEIRRAGAAALDLAYVAGRAVGWLLGHWALSPGIWRAARCWCWKRMA